MLKYVFLFTLIANLNLCGRVLGQPTAYLVEVEHITIDDGILGRKVLDFYQDKRGIIWVITPEGLNRFDGRDFKWYKEFKAKDYYQYNQKICEDGEGLLWIFESQYLKMGYYPIQHLIHTYTDEVIDFEKKIKHLPFDWQDIVDIIQGKNGGIHFLTNKNRIYTYRSNNIFKRYLDTKVKITSLLGENEKGEIWAKHIDIHNNINLIKISPNGQSEIYNLKVPELYFNFFKEKNSTDLFFDISNNESHFISISKNGKIKKFYFKEHKDIPDSILVNYSFPISHSKSSQNYDYLSTLFGFKIFSPTNEIAFDLDMIYPKENKYILDYGTTLFNNSNLLWVYSPDGIIKIHFKKRLFDKIQMESDAQKGLSCRKILRVNNELVIGFSDRSNEFQPFLTSTSKNPISPIYASDIIQEDDGYWSCKGNVISKTDKNKIIKKWDLAKISGNAAFGDISTIYKKKGGILFGADYSQGIFFPKNDSISFFVMDSILQKRFIDKTIQIYNFQEDSDGNLWAATNLGLIAVDIKNMMLNSYWKEGQTSYTLPQTAVHHFYQDEKGIYWLVGENLRRWDRATNNLKVFTPADGLPSHILHAIYPDDFGNFWMSSENGIIRFNKTTHQIKVYSTSDGITHDEFNRLSHFQDNDGTIYFGGMNGVTKFHPEAFQNDDANLSKNISFVITEFGQYSGAEQKVVDKLPELIKEKKITLASNDRFFRIQFTLPHYINNDQIQYEFKIKGHQEEWTSIKENYIRISGLPYGNFSLIVRGRLPSGVYVEDRLEIPIEVLRPFYLQAWFIIFCLGAMIGGILLYFKRREKIYKQQKIALEKLVTQRTAVIQTQKEALESSNSFKDRLFTIIAHDMRNAVYSFKDVTNMIQTFIKFDKPEKILDMSGAIETSSDNLQHLLDNLLEWALSQQGELPYEPELISIEKVFDESIHTFQNIANRHSINFHKEITQDLNIFVDKSSLDTIIRNLIGNAIKFTPKEGNISLIATSNGKHNIISIKDDGVGMTDEKMTILFSANRKKIRESLTGQKGSGIGLILVKELVELNKGKLEINSTPEKGTVIQLFFPKVSL